MVAGGFAGAQFDGQVLQLRGLSAIERAGDARAPIAFTSSSPENINIAIETERAAFDNIGFAPLQKRNTRIPAVAYGVICPLLYQRRCTYTSSQYTKSRRPNLKRTMTCICFASSEANTGHRLFEVWAAQNSKQTMPCICYASNKRCPVFAMQNEYARMWLGARHKNVFDPVVPHERERGG